MTNEELAQHWNLSLREVKNISNIINYLYSVELVSKCRNFSKFWEVVLCANDGKKDYILMEEGNHFSDKEQAIVYGTHWARNIKMTRGQAELMGIPKDAFRILRPINGYNQIIERLYHPTKKNVYTSRQRD